MLYALAGLATLLLVPMRTRRSTPEALVPKMVEPDHKRSVVWRAYIRTYTFPAGVIDRALVRCPKGTNATDLDRGLRQFFLACGSTTDLAAAMPSKTVDEAWHEFLTYTRDYAAFCDKAFGRLLHHVPETTMTTAELGQNHGLGMVTSWVAACQEENLPVFGRTAPALFDADRRAHAGSRGWRKPSGHTHPYVGFCGPDPALAPTTDDCAAPTGTVCMRHAYAPVWRSVGAEVTQFDARAPQLGSARATRPTTSTSTPSGHYYDAATMAALAPILIATADDLRDTTAAVDTTTSDTVAPSSSSSSCGSTPAQSSCGSSSSSSSSCGSSSSSCGSSSSSSSSSCGGGGGGCGSSG